MPAGLNVVRYQQTMVANTGDWISGAIRMVNKMSSDKLRVPALMNVMSKLLQFYTKCLIILSKIQSNLLENTYLCFYYLHRGFLTSYRRKTCFIYVQIFLSFFVLFFSSGCISETWDIHCMTVWVHTLTYQLITSKQFVLILHR